MTAAERLATVTRRMASATSIIRTRSDDGVRLVVHGGHNGELEARQLAAVRRIEAVAERLEKAIS